MRQPKPCGASTLGVKKYFAHLPSNRPKQPTRRRGRNILDGMVYTFWNQHFVTRFHADLFPANRELESAIHRGYQLVRRMNEIIPFPAGRIGEHLARIAASMPVLGYLFAIKRHRKFVKGEVVHERKLVTGLLPVSGVSDQFQLNVDLLHLFRRRVPRAPD